jgi:hypothetical protein
MIPICSPSVGDANDPRSNNKNLASSLSRIETELPPAIAVILDQFYTQIVSNGLSHSIARCAAAGGEGGGE